MRRNFRHVEMKTEEPDDPLPGATPGTGEDAVVNSLLASQPESFSDAIDQIGMGRFQIRIIVMGGMVIIPQA